MLAMHVTIQDEIYDGYVIPKGTHLLGNIWYVVGPGRRWYLFEISRLTQVHLV